MELRHLRYFIAVAEELNFSRAAERLHMAQPPLSQQIRALEEELGVKLFDRATRPLQLTLAGQTLLVEARLAVARVEQAVRLTQQACRGELGCLTVGFSSSIANSILPDILLEFRRRFPDVELSLCEFTSFPKIQGLRERAIDVGFFYLPNDALEADDLSSLTLWEEPLIVVLPETHPLATRSEIPLRSLKDEAFVFPTRQLVPSLSGQIDRLCDLAGFTPKVIQEATFMLTILGLIAGGVGVALLPANAQNLQRKGVVYRPLQGQTATIQIAIAWRRDDASVILHNFLEVTKAIAHLRGSLKS
jgi:DNA-binding transcriptional LysR family regulator